MEGSIPVRLFIEQFECQLEKAMDDVSEIFN